MCSNYGSGPEQTSRFGLEVDKKLRVKGAPQGSVWALGDCAVSGCAPTAQVASQQGKYLGSLFRDTKMDEEAIAAHPDFQFVNKGSLAYLGDGKGQHSKFVITEHG
jgi:NADH:ubiquinone reductase (non-electrogenic)